MLNGADVLCGRTLRPLDDLELDPLPFAQALEPRATDRGVVYEDVFRPVVKTDEAGLHWGCATRWGQRDCQAPGFMKPTRKATMASRPGSLQIMPPCLQRRPTSRLLALSTAALARG